MNALRRAARVVADEGVGELIRRLGRKALGQGRPEEAVGYTSPEEPVDFAACRAEYEQQVREFRARTSGEGTAGLDRYYWYHTIDLGGGLVTPGDYDYRHQLPAFGFPDDMTGMRVLDVGSATGFFAFEFERRGAQVVSVELPSMDQWDILAAERAAVVRDLMAFFAADTPEERYHRHLDGPFRYCQSALGSRVKRCYSPVYDLDLEKVGGERFDLIYVGDMLLHLFSPLKALDVLSGLCRGSLMVTVDVPFPGPAGGPLVAFRGKANLETDRRTWWALSPGAVGDMLGRLGFDKVSIVGRYSGIVRRDWVPYEREVVRATKT